jgi:hypothetical protein
MKLALGLVIVVATGSTAHAELAKLGDFALSDKIQKVKAAKATVLGCAGSVKHEVDTTKVTGLSFTGDKCDQAALAAAIQKEYAAKPITSTDGRTRLWEGKTSAIMLTGKELRLLPPGAGSKRACFADDGFPAFFKTFKDALAAGKADAVAAQFKFPIKDFDDKVVVKDAKAFAKKFDEMFDKDDRKAGALEATCDVTLEYYETSLANSNFGLEARRVGDQWKWVELNFQSPD